MKGSIGDEIRLKHIADSIQKIETALQGHTFNTFFDNKVLVAATERWLEIIGEAAKHISKEIKEQYPDIEWKKWLL